MCQLPPSPFPIPIRVPDAARALLGAIPCFYFATPQVFIRSTPPALSGWSALDPSRPSLRDVAFALKATYSGLAASLVEVKFLIPVPWRPGSGNGDQPHMPSKSTNVADRHLDPRSLWNKIFHLVARRKTSSFRWSGWWKEPIRHAFMLAQKTADHCDCRSLRINRANPLCPI